MKKKLLFICLLLFTFIFSINATSSEAKPKTNNSGLETGTVIDMSVDDGFDFSLVNFDSTIENQKIVGKSNFKKIYSGDLSGDYFTAYCLDGNKKYPEYSTIYSTNSSNSSNLIKYMAYFQVLKECGSLSSCNLFDDVSEVEGYYLDGIDTPDTTTITNFENGDTISIGVSSIGYTLKNKTLSASDRLKLFNYNTLTSSLNKTGDGSKITVSFKKNDFLTNHYVVSNMPSEIEYKKALWIIEHSYPTITIDEFITATGSNYTSLKNELTSLYVDDIFTNDCTFASNKLTCTDLGLSDVTAETESTAKQTIKEAISESTITKLVEDYVYGTVQYAIWKTIGVYYENVEVSGTYQKAYLGSTLNGSTELNKIYQYLLVDRTEEYNKYDNSNYSNDLEISKPNKESYKSTSDSEYYGPYTVKSSMLYTDTSSIKVALLSNNDNIALVDSNLNELTFTKVNTYTGDQAYLNDKKIYSLNSDLVFYVKMSGTDKTTTSLSLALIGSGKNYPNAQKRGKILYSESALDQVVGISAVLENVDVLKQVTIEYNAKTADVNIGYVLVALLVSFVFGYIALRYNKAPIDNL